MLKASGEQVFDTIEANTGGLREVASIGAVRAQRIVFASVEQKAMWEIMVYLHSHGVRTALAVRMFKTYAPDTIQVMTDTPCPLARDIGCGNFGTADAIAVKVDIYKTVMFRVGAGFS